MSARPTRAGSRRCLRCGSTDLLELSLSIGEEPVSFTSCHACESTWWERSGATLPLKAVLQDAGRR